MIRDSGQFGAFDGLDNRKNVMELFVRLGERLRSDTADEKRAKFLQALIRGSSSAFRQLPFQITPCSPAEAYHLFVAITGVLGVNVDWAAKQLENMVRKET